VARARLESRKTRSEASPLGAMRCALVWMRSDELLADLATVMDQAPVPVIDSDLAAVANR